MEALSSGLTWAQIEEAFAQSANYSFSLTNRNRRVKPGKYQGADSQTKVWRLIIQRSNKGLVRTILRKNLKDAPENIFETVASDKQIQLINGLL